MPQRLATFFWHLWCTFMLQSGVREKQAHQGPCPGWAASRPSQGQRGVKERTGERRALGGSAGFPVFRKNVFDAIMSTLNFSLFKGKENYMGPNYDPSKNVWDNLDKSFFLQGSCFSPISEAGGERGGEVHLGSTCSCAALTLWVFLYSDSYVTFEDAELREVGPPVQ